MSIKTGRYLDGGTTDPIPVAKALTDGCNKVVVVLTRDRNYRKQPESMRPIYKHVLKKYPAMITALDKRHEVYNNTLDLLKKLEKDGTALVLAPPQEVTLSRFEKSPDKLQNLYQQGYNETKRLKKEIKNFLEQ